MTSTLVEVWLTSSAAELQTFRMVRRGALRRGTCPRRSCSTCRASRQRWRRWGPSSGTGWRSRSCAPATCAASWTSSMCVSSFCVGLVPCRASVELACSRVPPVFITVVLWETRQNPHHPALMPQGAFQDPVTRVEAIVAALMKFIRVSKCCTANCLSESFTAVCTDGRNVSD